MNCLENEKTRKETNRKIDSGFYNEVDDLSKKLAVLISQKCLSDQADDPKEKMK